jgi:nifR3 family TIM-barrel protein
MSEFVLRLGSVAVSPPFVLGPMAGYTSLPFRLLCRRGGAGLAVSEMVSARALQYGSHKTAALMTVCPQERPVALQVFGGEPEGMAEAARAAAEAGADVVDLNMGCTVPKVRRAGAGTELMADPDRAVAVARACCRAVPIPVMVKYRAGLFVGDESYLELGRRLQDAGVAGLTLHGRSANAGFRGTARWETVAALAETVSIPVIGSGDVTDAATAVRRLRDSGCAAVMIARGALGRPWVFGQAGDLLRGQPARSNPSPWERLGVALCHAQLLAEHEGELSAVRQMRSHLPHYTRGLPHATWLRGQGVKVGSLAGLGELVREYGQRLAEWDWPVSGVGAETAAAPSGTTGVPALDVY